MYILEGSQPHPGGCGGYLNIYSEIQRLYMHPFHLIPYHPSIHSFYDIQTPCNVYLNAFETETP